MKKPDTTQKEHLTILQVAPIYLPISRNLLYAGIERVVSFLDSEFTKAGHDSRVAATGNSEIDGRLISTLPDNAWQEKSGGSKFPQEFETHFERVLDHIVADPDIDVVHDHSGQFVKSRAYEKRNGSIDVPVLTTLHNGTNFYEELGLYEAFLRPDPKTYFNALSDSQRRLFSVILEADAVVYNGLDVETYPVEHSKGDYLFSLGRICDAKGQDVAIEVAKALDMPLVIAGSIHENHREWFEANIEPHLDGEQIRYIGPVNDEQKKGWYKDAKAFMMPIKWPEPFGLVMIEAMACGTPVIGFRQGAAPEVVAHGETGYIVDTTEEMIEATRNAHLISPQACRDRVDRLFSAEAQANNYLRLYRDIARDFAPSRKRDAA